MGMERGGKEIERVSLAIATTPATTKMAVKAPEVIAPAATPAKAERIEVAATTKTTKVTSTTVDAVATTTIVCMRVCVCVSVCVCLSVRSCVCVCVHACVEAPSR